VFADESGNFDFSRGSGATQYFILTTVTVENHSEIAADLQNLRYRLAWEDLEIGGPFHATTDQQAVRDEVFEVLALHDFRVDATILEKSKAKPEIRLTDERFYQTAWYFHMRFLAPKIADSNDGLLVVASSVGTRKKRGAFHRAVQDVTRQVSPTRACRTVAWDASCDPCLQVADYCSWAIQRKWERGDQRSYELIQGKIRSEFDLFSTGKVRYY